MAADQPPSPPPRPLLLIGGYLGAGKTTLVNHLLRHAAGRRIAVLVNDFGDINIDADLIAADAADAGTGDVAGDGASADVLSLSGGCLCCSFGDDLVGTLNGLARRSPPPDLLVIELSGVAQPAAVLRTARLAQGVQPAGTWVVADAAALRRQVTDPYVGDTVRQQLASADWVVLNKPDLVDSATGAGLMDWLPTLAPQATALACAVADLPADWVLGAPHVPQAPQAPQEQQAPHTPPTPHTRPADGPDPDPAALARMAARPLRPQAQPASAIFESQHHPLPPGTDLAALGAALAAPGQGVERAKALAVGPDGTGQLLQVAGGRWAVTPARVQGQGRLVLIGLRGQMPPAGWWMPAAGA